MSDKLQNIIRKYALEDGLTVDAKTILSFGSESNCAFLYSFYYLDRLSDTFVVEEKHRLPAQRAEKCEGYRHQSDKKACLLSYLFLIEGLRERYGIAGDPTFIYNEHGKPYLRDTPGIFFNFSHSGNTVACALANFEIGLDIQEIRKLNMGVAHRVCSENELQQLKDSDNARRLFCNFWTKKESYAKAMGVGVPGLFKQDIPADRFFSWEGESFCMTIACNLP